MRRMVSAGGAMSHEVQALAGAAVDSRSFLAFSRARCAGTDIDRDASGADRRQTHLAVDRRTIAVNPTEPDWNGWEYYLGIEKREGGTGMAPSLRQHVASEMGKQAAIDRRLKQGTPCDDEVARTLGGGGWDGDKHRVHVALTYVADHVRLPRLSVAAQGIPGALAFRTVEKCLEGFAREGAHARVRGGFAAARVMAAGYPPGAAPAEQAAGTPLAFAPLEPAPDVGFWRELTRRKLDVLRLDDSPIPVCGAYEAFGERPKCLLLEDSFSSAPAFEGKALVRGDLKNFNTQEDFRAFLSGGARGERIVEATRALQEAIVSGAGLVQPHLLRPMLIVAFADLKKYHYAYTVSLPVLALPSKPWLAYRGPQGAEEFGLGREVLQSLSSRLARDAALAAAGVFLLVRSSTGEPWDVKPLGELTQLSSVSDEDLVVGFVDPSSGNCGWPLRNLLLALAHHRPGNHPILSFRDPHLASNGAGPIRSRVVFAHADPEAARLLLDGPPPAGAAAAGWSKIQTMDLTVFLDKRKIAADAVDLNVKLMKWRMLPELEPEKMRSLSVLLLGSGTLGCSVARTLMAWGVRKMTFLDNGRVSLSNPVRQSLFTHADAAASRPKAQAAAEAVLAVMPDAEVDHVELEIPMPGHPHQSAEALEKSVERLKGLVDSHDVVCMLTDSRESRWLPSLLVAASQQRALLQPEELAGRPPPLGLTVALGFDSFLVSRQTYMDAPAACYFCNDVTAPA
ncbi:unnamed protein product, partial [Prorocentrum cordatum]